MTSFRSMASHIVKACRERGLKQSVVLDAIVKSQGFRSIQAAEAATSAHSVPRAMGLTVMIRTDLFRHYPDSNFLSINLQEDLLAATINSDDAIFDELWALAYTDAQAVYPALQKMIAGTHTLLAAIEASTDGVHHTQEDALPKCLQGLSTGLLIVCCSELSLGCDADERAQGVSIKDTQLALIRRIHDALDDMIEGFQPSHYRHFDLCWFNT